MDVSSICQHKGEAAHQQKPGKLAFYNIATLILGTQDIVRNKVVLFLVI